MTPRIKDNDRDEITAHIDGREIRGWSYASEAERRQKMLMAREFAEGWARAMDVVKACSALRTRQMNAELPTEQREMLELKGMI